MKDLYKILELTKSASASEIKKAYRMLALKAHPDKGGSKEMMVLLNEAYQTLSDPVKRKKYDSDWSNYLKTNVDLEIDCVIDGHLPAGDTPSYSHAFRAEHQALVTQYAKTPLESFNKENFKSLESNIYHIKVNGMVINSYNDIFSFIRGKVSRAMNGAISPPTELLTPTIAINTFIDFLSGNYFGNELAALKKYFLSEINKIRSLNAQSPLLLLYDGIDEIISSADEMPGKQYNLVFSIKKITDFAKNAPDLTLQNIIPLFYNKYFRNLYAYALTLYWKPAEDLFDEANLSKFDGRQDAKDLLNELREKFSGDGVDENVTNLIQYSRLLYSFDKDLHESGQLIISSGKYREAAFHLLDWMPALLDRSEKKILVNTLLQIGVKLQQASRLEVRPALKMADEKLALKLYLTAAVIGNNSTPDVEIYANTQVLKYIANFQYQDLMLTEVIEGLKRRTFIMTDIFPFFESAQSNVAILRQEKKAIHLMRHFLNTLVKIYEYNKTHSDGIVIEHSSATILYQAYEACLKNWFQEAYQPEVEKKLRLDLMDELLLDNDWTFLDVEQRIDSPWIMIDRDEQGWIRPTRSLPYTMEKDFQVYRTINGVEINQKTGEINFFMTPWTQGRPIYEKLFTLFDLQEMLENNITGAIFSLDPADPDKPYHPFNLMRFSPSQLCDSELLNTMLLTDYVLKFLTTNQEVQGQYPFDQRSVAPMIQHLPEYLRNIVARFHAEPHSGALHRFWIEAEEIDISMPDKMLASDTARITLSNMKMVVKKHRMERDSHGELKDVGSEDEGWPIYVLTMEQMIELEMGIRAIDSHAMIFIYNESILYFWEHNKIIHTYHPDDFRESLIRLYKQPKDQTGKVAQNTKNMPLIYRITKEMTHQSGLSHRYSPEFIFAHEFTTHYDEFAQFLPEFGRLKELSKISALIRVLNGMRQSNLESIQALDYLLDTSSPTPPDTETYRIYNESYQKVHQNVISLFQDWRKQVKSFNSQEKARAYTEIRKQFTGSSTKDIARAIDKDGELHAEVIAKEEAHRQLREQRELNKKLESGFVRISLGKHEEPIDLKGKCFWVPASTRHEVRKDATTGLARYSFFVYGGVSLQPRINTAMGGNRPLGGNAVGGGSFNRTEITRGYQSHHIISPTNKETRNHELLRLAGFNNLDSRPNRIYLPTHESQHPSRSIHSGRHTQDAMDRVSRKMDDVVARGKSENWSQSQYRSGLRDMLASERQDLRAGNVALNSKYRPWSNPKY